MIPIKEPNFIKSEYFYIDDKGWNLRKGAPDNIKEEFDSFMKTFVGIRTGDLKNFIHKIWTILENFLKR